MEGTGGEIVDGSGGNTNGGGNTHGGNDTGRSGSAVQDRPGDDNQIDAQVPDGGNQPASADDAA